MICFSHMNHEVSMTAAPVYTNNNSCFRNSCCFRVSIRRRQISTGGHDTRANRTRHTKSSSTQPHAYNVGYGCYGISAFQENP